MDQQALDKLQNIRANKKTFAQLSIGDTFDFIDMSRPMFNSFYRRCVKTSTRKYETIDAPVMQCRVGSVSARVYHVADANGLSPEHGRLTRAELFAAIQRLNWLYGRGDLIEREMRVFAGRIECTSRLQYGTSRFTARFNGRTVYARGRQTTVK